ncbi:MAG: serine/threonine-protein kinase [Candidatus Saccharibacteria bacterium]
MDAQPTTRLEDVQKFFERTPYRVLRFFAAGGSSELWQARDIRSNELVVIKCLLPAMKDEKSLAAFQREARLLRRLRHMGIVELRSSYLDAAKAPDVPYHVLEHVIGRPLSVVIKLAPIRGTEIIELATSLARGLAYLGTEGIVHRDIKPANIIWDPNHAVIVDFGIAIEYQVMTSADDYRPVCLLPTGKRIHNHGDDTATGTVNGTPGFIAPEVFNGAPADHRSDLFSLGVTLYHAVAGYKPFQGSTDMETAMRTVHDAPPVFFSGNNELDHIICQLLQKNPDDRFQSAEELLYVLSTLHRA